MNAIHGLTQPTPEQWSEAKARGLKTTAIKLYESEVLVESAREQFRKNVEKLPVTDGRKSDAGKKQYYCSYCKKFAAKPQMTMSTGPSVIYVWSGGDITGIMVCNKHYDGCRGWD